MPTYGKTKLEIAAERYQFDPQRLGKTHRYVFNHTQITNGDSQQAPPINVETQCLLLALGGQSDDGAAASYAGLSLQFTYASQDFASDGQTASSVPFGVLFGNQSHPWHEWEIPIMLAQRATLISKVFNNSANPRTPTVVALVVELN